MDHIMNHSKAKEIVKKDGFQGMIDHFNEEFENRKFYGCSEAWYEEDTEHYILKLRGQNGDLIVGWEGYHD